MHFRKLILVLLLSTTAQLMNANLLMAQNLDEKNFIRYTRLQGLSNNYIAGMVQDSAGYIWIATHKGLNRFDGKIFQALFKSSQQSPLPDNLLVNIHQQTANEIIGTTRAGAFAFYPASRKYKKFIVPCDSNIFFWANHALDIVKDKKGHYIISTKTGLYVFNSEAKLLKRYDHHTAADVGKTELIFGGWVSLLSNGSTLQQNGLLGSVYDPNNNNIDTLHIAKNIYLKKQMTDTNGNMKMAWCGPNDEILILNEQKNTIDVTGISRNNVISNPMPFPVGIDLGWTSKITFISDSVLAITCRNSGFYLLHYNSLTKRLSSDGKKYFNGIACTAIFKDRENRMWIGTADGLYKQNLQNSFFSVTDIGLQSPGLINREIRSIYVDDNLIFAGLQNEGGLLVLDKKTGAIKTYIRFAPQELFNNSIGNIFPYDADTLWIGTNRGIIWFNKNNYHYGKLKIPAAFNWTEKINSNCFFQDSRKNIWISFGAVNSLLCYSKASRTFSTISPTNHPLLKITYIFSMAEDLSGNIWLAGDGLCRWNIKKNSIDTLIPYPKVSASLRNYMHILGRDPHNNLWLSSFDNEIIQYNCSSNSMYLRQQENNLVDGNTITNSPIINNYIWMGTDNGISAFNINDYSVKQFTYANGLPSVSISTVRKGSFYDKISNRFYIGAGHLLISFVADVSLSHKIPPSLSIEKISTRDSSILNAPDSIKLKYDQNNITVTFNTINFTDPEENRFAWRSLNTSDTNWNDLNSQTSITLNNLPGGWNSVQVKLFSANNHWPQQVKKISIYIVPPFWRTTWFMLLGVALLASLIFIIYRTRINAIRKKERQKVQVQQLLAEEYKNRLELEQVTNYFSSSLAGKKNVDEVLWDVAKNLIGRMNYEDCIIYMWNNDKTRMIQKAAHGPKGNPKVIDLQSFDVLPGQGLVGHVIQTKEPLLVADTRKDPRYRVDDTHRLSELCVPILHNNELIGIIDSEHSCENHFQEKDIKILTTIATLVGNKIKQLESENSLVVKQKEIAFINQQLAEAQLAALQAQMNPHFIFNCLNSIKGMILNNDQQKASRYLSRFANIIRTTLNQSKEVFTTLYENLEHLECYLVMEKLRFDNSFSFNCTVDNNIDQEETLIPTLMIQPLVENAIWHGLMYKKTEKSVSIHFYKINDTIYCSIEDNGIGIRRSEELKKTNRPTHQPIGLSNLRNRIKILNEKYNAGCTFEIKDLSDLNKDKTGTSAVLSFNIINNKPFL